jgi:hypothetical protein
MASYYQDILIDLRTSCTKSEAVAIMLGIRTFDPIYQNRNDEADRSEVYEHFMEWLDISIFEHLQDERTSALSDLEDARNDEKKDQGKIGGCRSKILACDERIRQAKQYLCDIDDELAKGSESKLRLDKNATAEFKRPYITFSSLKKWSESREGNPEPEIAQSFRQPAPPANPALPREPLLDDKGRMSAASAKSFLATFGVLLEAFLDRAGPQFKSESGTDFKMDAVAEHLSKRSLPGAREGHFLEKQSVSSVEERLKAVKRAELVEVPRDQVMEVIEASTVPLNDARAKARSPRKSS